jgi:hypothetical protein
MRCIHYEGQFPLGGVLHDIDRFRQTGGQRICHVDVQAHFQGRSDGLLATASIEHDDHCVRPYILQRL